MKADEDLKHIPVVILTTFNFEEDMIKTYNLHANCYITKPIELGHFVKVVQAVQDYWLSIVELPRNAANHGAEP
jgi:response regulator RpfG family c-di-GMP phosphodiesterase